ncbi:MAG TPA: phosphotransferase, partial [Dehalococcoidia bacterium]
MTSADPQVEDVLKLYGINDAAVSRLTSGYINTSYRIDAPAGTFLLKQYAAGLPEYEPSQVLFSTTLSESMRKHGIRAPAVFPNRDGALVTQAEELCYVLSEFVTGRQFARGA